MAFFKCYYHIVWATKRRLPLINSPIEAIILRTVEQKCAELRCKLLAVNTALDHIHTAVAIPPAIAVADVIGNLKGTSSRAINLTLEQTDRFRWQESYGVLTFGETALPFVRNYIARQKEHHQQGSTYDYLERID
jgi:putative transposase